MLGVGSGLAEVDSGGAESGLPEGSGVGPGEASRNGLPEVDSGLVPSGEANGLPESDSVVPVDSSLMLSMTLSGLRR